MDFDFDKFDDNKKVDDLEPPVDYRKDEKEIEPPEEEKKDDKRKKRKKSTKSSATDDGTKTVTLRLKSLTKNKLLQLLLLLFWLCLLQFRVSTAQFIRKVLQI